MAAPAYSNPPVQKTLYRIGEVSKLTNTKAFVLRYWETEFPMLQPVKSPSGHRLYRKEDIETVHEIKHLLYEKGFTIAGARRHLAEASGAEDDAAGASSNGNRAAESRAAVDARVERRDAPRESGMPARAETARGYVAPARSEFEQSRRAQESGPGLHTAQAAQASAAKVGGASAGAATGVSPAKAAPASQISETQRAATAAQRAALLELRERLSAILTLLEDE